MSAELEARRTAAAALVADFRAEVARHPLSRPPDGSWALRLAIAVDQLLEVTGGQLDEPGKLAAVRAVFDVFDWETDDRQYALEQIEDIMRGQS